MLKYLTPPPSRVTPRHTMAGRIRVGGRRLRRLAARRSASWESAHPGVVPMAVGTHPCPAVEAACLLPVTEMLPPHIEGGVYRWQC